MEIENPIRTLGDYSRPSHEGYRNTIELPDGKNMVPLTAKLQNDILMFQQHQAAGGKLRDKKAEESWALLEDLALYDNESWNDPRDFAKLVKEISLPQEVPSTSNCRLIELENQVQRLMEAHLAPKSSVQMNKIDSSREIYSGPHDTQYCMENPKQTFVEYASLRNKEVGGKQFTTYQGPRNFNEATNAWKDKTNFNWARTQTFTSLQNGSFSTYSSSYQTKLKRVLSDFDSHQEKRLSSLGTQLKQQQDNVINKYNTLWKKFPAHVPIYDALLDKYIKSLKLGNNGSAFIQGEMPEKIKDPRLFILPCRLGDSKPFDTLADLGSCVNLIPLNLFKKLKIGLLEETERCKLKLVEDFYAVDMEKDPTCPLLVGRGFLATASAVIDCKKAKIAVGEGITRSIFSVKEINFGEENIPYWTTIGKRESYTPQPSTDGIGARPPTMRRKTS
ncbi:hypothetical protein Tco_1457993 [Tanacetum coccineum]